MPDVWGQDFLYQWSPPANVRRDLTPGPQHIRLSSQSTPRLTGEAGVDYASLFKSMRDGGWSACEAGSAGWLARKMPESEKQEIKAQLKALDVVFYGIHCAGNIIGPDPDAERWQRHIIDAIHSAEEMGCQLVLTHVGSMDYEVFLTHISRLKRPMNMLVEFLTTNEEYQQAQRNIRAITAKVGVKIYGTQA